MSLAEAEEKFKELIKLVSVAEAQRLRRAYENFKMFTEGEEYRHNLIYEIKEAVKQSLAEAVEMGKISVKDALDVLDEVATYCEIYRDIVVIQGHIDALIRLLDELIFILKSNKDYYDWIKDLWTDLQEIVKEVFGE